MHGHPLLNNNGLSIPARRWPATIAFLRIYWMGIRKVSQLCYRQHF